jgi:hypothetical protein
MVLRAGVERTLTHPRNPPENLEALDATLAEIHRMTELVENLLTLARADEGRAALAVAPCDLREPLAEAAETAGILAEGKDITVTTRMPPDPVELDVDRSRIRQCRSTDHQRGQYTDEGDPPELTIAQTAGTQVGHRRVRGRDLPLRPTASGGDPPAAHRRSSAPGWAAITDRRGSGGRLKPRAGLVVVPLYVVLPVPWGAPVDANSQPTVIACNVRVSPDMKGLLIHSQYPRWTREGANVHRT